MVFYRRKLPHWQPEGMALFVTWRLSGSLPSEVKEKIVQNGPGKAFLIADRFLDKASKGPLWLNDPTVAKMVVEAIKFGENSLKLYLLVAYVVMANHVHALWIPHAPLSKITHTIKSFTALKANQMLDREGKRFWQDESFDHWVRSETELRRIVRYIEYNPVRAGLVERVENWPWSSATGRTT